MPLSLDPIKGVGGLVSLVGFMLLCFSVASGALAATYHVDASNGDDARDGLSAIAAWRSLDRVNALQLQPGDSVLLAAGSVFQGQLKPVGEGSEERPVTIGMYGQGKMPRIDGNGAVDAPLLLYNTQHIIVQDLHLTNTGAQPGEKRRGLIIQIEDFGVARNITARRLVVTDVNGSLVKKVSGGAILFRNSGEKVKSRFDGLLIEHCYIARTERNGINGSSGYAGRSNWFPSTNVVIRNNLLEEIPGDGIVPIGCDGALVEGNVVRNGLPLDGKKYSAAAGIWPWSSDNTIIQYNEVSQQRQSNDGQGFDADWNCRGTIIQYNYSHDNDGGFALICNDGKAGPGYSIGNTGTIIRHNVSFNDGLREVAPDTTPGRVAPAININGPVDNVTIHGNLIIVPKKPTPEVDRHLVRVTKWNGFGRDIEISGNVFVVEEQAIFDLKNATRCLMRDNRTFGPVMADAAQIAPLPESPIPEPFQHPGVGVKNALRLLDACGLR